MNNSISASAACAPVTPHIPARHLLSWAMVMLTIAMVSWLFIYINGLQQREHATAAAEQSLTTLLRDTNTAMVEIDPASNIISWNAAATELFGYAAEEAIGQPLSMLMPDAATAHAHGNLVKAGFARPTSHVVVMNCAAKHKTGELVAIRLTAFLPAKKRTAVALINRSADVAPGGAAAHAHTDELSRAAH